MTSLQRIDPSNVSRVGEPLHAPPAWAYFLFGGSNGSSPQTRFISSGWFGEISWGPGELFKRWLPRAKAAGAVGAWLENPFGLDSIAPPNLMEADQALRAMETPSLGAGWVADWSDGLANFCAENPGWPVLVYCGGFEHPRFKSLRGGAWAARAWQSYEPWLFEQPNLSSVHVGFDASCADGADSREEAFRRLVANCGATPWVEGYWRQSNRWMAGRYDCIVTNSLWKKPHYVFAERQGRRVLRLLDTNPTSLNLNDRIAHLREHMRDCAATQHEAALPAHFWLTDDLTIANLWKGKA